MDIVSCNAGPPSIWDVFKTIAGKIIMHEGWEAIIYESPLVKQDSIGKTKSPFVIEVWVRIRIDMTDFPDYLVEETLLGILVDVPHDILQCSIRQASVF